MEIVNFDKEFVERTKEIIEQSQCFEHKITLLLNCMLALVNLPTERTGKNDESFKSDIIQKIKSMQVIDPEVSTTDDKLFKGVRNALSHMHINIENKNGIIDEIILCDKYPKATTYHTKLKFNTQQLKEFAIFVADKHLERLSTQNTKKI